MKAAFAAFYVMLGTFAGLGLLSLSIQRHYIAQWPQRALPPGRPRRDKSLLQLSGAICICLAIAAALADNVQLGALFWSGYFMIAGLLVTGMQSYAVTRTRIVILGATGLFGVLTLAAFAAFLR